MSNTVLFFLVNYVEVCFASYEMEDGLKSNRTEEHTHFGFEDVIVYKHKLHIFVSRVKCLTNKSSSDKFLFKENEIPFYGSVFHVRISNSTV